VLQRNNLSPQRVILVEQMLLSAVSRHVSARKKWPAINWSYGPCFPFGGSTEELRRKFEKATFLRRQSFYETLRYCKQQGWLMRLRVRAFASGLTRSPYNAATASHALRADKIRHLSQKFPRENFQSIEEWSAAVVEEIKSGLHPGTPGFAILDRTRRDPATEAFRGEIIRMHSFVTTIHMREFLDDDFEQQERLDARFAKLRKELIEIKTTKPMLR
jgi:hypothetical protein